MDTADTGRPLSYFPRSLGKTSPPARANRSAIRVLGHVPAAASASLVGTGPRCGHLRRVGWRWDWAREVRELVFALDADPAGQQQWRQLARQAALRGSRGRCSRQPPWGVQRRARGVGGRDPRGRPVVDTQPQRPAHGARSLRTSPRLAQSASPSCRWMVTSCPRTLNVWRGRTPEVPAVIESFPR